jgi:hypothetical protein
VVLERPGEADPSLEADSDPEPDLSSIKPSPEADSDPEPDPSSIAEPALSPAAGKGGEACGRNSDPDATGAKDTHLESSDATEEGVAGAAEGEPYAFNKIGLLVIKKKKKKKS